MPQYGINLDPDHKAGLPLQAQDLCGLKWVRFVFQAQPHQKRTIQQSCEFYAPLIDTYRALGIRTLLILNHQTFVGDEPWKKSNGNWRSLCRRFQHQVRRDRPLLQRSRRRLRALERRRPSLGVGDLRPAADLRAAALGEQHRHQDRRSERDGRLGRAGQQRPGQLSPASQRHAGAAAGRRDRRSSLRQESLRR